MSAFETLPPDQRAVLQLILKQGRGYADLSGLLRIDEAAVRARAHAGVEALVPAGTGAALPAERREQIADYLLGQQDDDARAETLEQLKSSRAGRRWARALHEQLAPYATSELPELPGVRNGTATIAPAEPVEAPPVEEMPAEEVTPAEEAPAPDFSWDRRPAEQPHRASKLGGLLLIGGVAALLVVVAIIFINSNNDGGGSDANVTTQPAQTQAARTTATRAAADEDTQIVQQINLTPPGGGAAPIGIAFILLRDDRAVVAVQVERVAANGQDDIYAAWLRESANGRARFLGYVPGQVGADGRFTVQADLPRDTLRFDQVVVSREAIRPSQTPTTPASIVLQGTIRRNRTG